MKNAIKIQNVVPIENPDYFKVNTFNGKPYRVSEFSKVGTDNFNEILKMQQVNEKLRAEVIKITGILEYLHSKMTKLLPKELTPDQLKEIEEHNKKK